MTTLNGQILGQAERATRAVLDRLLDRAGTDFHGWVLLNLTADGAEPVPHAALAARMAAGLKIGEVEAAAVVERLVGAGLIAGGGDRGLAQTAAGAELYRRIGAGVAEVTTRLYGGIPADELAVAGRVLRLVTVRADAELAA
ncbi:hypothetical protein QEZ54_18485 [Catellatospora sp. KI3]|uniref:hypothetical protein n=1 Tax=Catellatospora sp. KI3 TaxID=3041620 RepID=UPI0024823312|nr:hypothetical protein [Catellatospora sp. KI3]MDI1462968.1 hypothetical protein [Catellatospora sp. KI3]